MNNSLRSLKIDTLYFLFMKTTKRYFQLIEAFAVIGILRLVDHCKNKGKLIETKDMDESDSFSKEYSDKGCLVKLLS